jgi:hypothetical protein
MPPGTARFAVFQPLHQWKPSKPHAAASGQVMYILPRRHLASSCRQPLRHIFFQPPAFISTPDRLSGLSLSAFECLVSPGNQHHGDTAFTRRQRGLAAASRVSGYVSVLIGHFFLCCCCAKCKLVGASKAQCSDRCLLPHRCRELRRRIPERLLEEA